MNSKKAFQEGSSVFDKDPLNPKKPCPDFDDAIRRLDPLGISPAVQGKIKKLYEALETDDDRREFLRGFHAQAPTAVSLRTALFAECVALISDEQEKENTIKRWLEPCIGSMNGSTGSLMKVISELGGFRPAKTSWRPRSISAEQETEIKRLHEAGMSQRKIAAELGLSHRQVRTCVETGRSVQFRHNNTPSEGDKKLATSERASFEDLKTYAEDPSFRLGYGKANADGGRKKNNRKKFMKLYAASKDVARDMLEMKYVTKTADGNYTLDFAQAFKDAGIEDASVKGRRVKTPLEKAKYAVSKLDDKDWDRLVEWMNSQLSAV